MVGRHERQPRSESRERVKRVRDLMTAHVVTCAPSTSLADAAALLMANEVHALVVNDDGGRPLGVLSDFDLLAGEWLGTDEDSLAALRGMRADELMSSPAVTVAAGAPIAEAARQLHEERLGRLVVVDGERTAGVLSLADVVGSLVELPTARATVADVMSRGLVVCAADTTLTQAARAMHERHSRSLVVVDAAGAPLGVVTGHDVAGRVADGAGNGAVADLIHPPLTIAPQATLSAAADEMLEREVHRLLVVDPDRPGSMPLGMISTRDIVAQMASPGSVWRGG
jgi:CBS domain-containing protein